MSEKSGAWKVVSSQHQRGWCLPSFIHNSDFFYANVIAYEDGVVDCWHEGDLPFFRERLKAGWVVTSPAEGATLSVHNLGAGKVVKFESLLSLEEVEARAAEAIRFWALEAQKQVDSGNESSRFVGTRLLWHGTHYRVDSAGTHVLAREVPVFVREGRSLRLTRWFVYADGKSRIGPEGELGELAEAEELVISGRLVMCAPDYAWFEVDGVGRAQLSEGSWRIDAVERIREQRDHLVALRGEEDAINACMRQWRAYQGSSSPEELERLRERYLAVPKHLRMYCGDMDGKDGLIRRALGIGFPWDRMSKRD